MVCFKKYMNTINFKNNIQSNSLSPEVQKRLEDKENFTAVDKEKLKQDVVEIKEKTREHAEENFVSQTVKNLGPKNKKKFFISLAATLATVAGLAVLGNKSSTKMAELGIKVDNMLKNQKWFNSIGKLFKRSKNKITNTLRKSKTINNIMDTLKNRPAKAKCDFTRGYGRGFVSIFSLTPIDILKKAFKDEDAQRDALKILVGKDNAENFVQFLSGKGSTIKDNKEFCSKLTNAIKDKFNLTTKEDLLSFLKALQKGETYRGNDLSRFTNVKMEEKGLGGIIGAWWPVNIINGIGEKIFKGKWKGFGKGNLGDSLIKFNAVNGSLADTKIGSLVQKSITIPTESISNFVNDKAGLGLFLCSTIMSLYNNVQDAPKEKRAATIADDYIGTIGSIAISTPLAFATTYGLASLKNLDSNQGIPSKILKGIGKFFGMGLDKYQSGTLIPGTKNIIPRFAGGALRFGLVMLVFSPFFSKPIKKVINKIFGKPYDANEAKREEALKQQRNTIIPELGITQGELEDKIKANPNALNKVQQDPMLLKEIQNNPKLIVDILDGKEIKTKPKDKLLSPANINLINNKNKTPQNNQRELFGLENNKKETKDESINTQDTATYIPSSELIAKSSSLSEVQNQEYQQLIAEADKALKNAEKYI